MTAPKSQWQTKEVATAFLKGVRGAIPGAKLPSACYCLLTLSMASAGWARDFYVSSSGNDSSDGQAAHPWRSFKKAADVAAAGDLVHVAAGDYAGFNLVRSGTEGRPIAFLAAPGARIISEEPTHQCGINLEGASYIVIDGFEVNGRIRAGIRVAGTPAAVTKHVVIRNNKCDQNGYWGILTGFSDDLLIENNLCSGSVHEHGIYVANSSRRPVVRNNVCRDNAGCGLQMNGDKNMGGHGLITKALVERNTICGNGRKDGSGINCDGVQNSTFRDNLLYGNHASGIALFREDGAEGSTNNLVVNNTIVQASDGRWALNIQNQSTGNQIFNNILGHGGKRNGSISISLDSLAGLKSDHNVVTDRFATDGGDSVFNLEEWKSRYQQDQHSFIAAPAKLFVDPAKDDYRPRPDSPAIGTGIPATAPAGLASSSEKLNCIGARFFCTLLEPTPGRAKDPVPVSSPAAPVK